MRTHQISGLLTPSNIVKAEKVRRIFKEQQSGWLRNLCQFLVKYGNNKLLIICSCQVFLLPLISSSRVLFPRTAKYVKKFWYPWRYELWPTQNNIELNEISCDSIFWPWLVQLILGWRGWKFNEPSHNYILSIFLFYFTIHVFRDLPKIAKSKRIVKLTLMTKFSYLFTMYPSKEKSHRNLPSRKNFQRTRMKRTTIIVLCWVLSIMV